MWKGNGPRRRYRYWRLCLQTMAALMAVRMPVSVSPSFMFDTSMAVIVVGCGRGFNGIDRRVGGL